MTLLNAPISGNTFRGGVDWANAAADTSSGYAAAGPTSCSWNGQFFGNTPTPSGRPDVYPAPVYAAGESAAPTGTPSGTGNYTNLHGAFGAVRKKEHAVRRVDGGRAQATRLLHKPELSRKRR